MSKKTRTFKGFRGIESIKLERTGGKDTHCSICGANILAGYEHKDFCLHLWRGRKEDQQPKLRGHTLQPGEADESGIVYQGPTSLQQIHDRTIVALIESVIRQNNGLEKRVRILEFNQRLRLDH